MKRVTHWLIVIICLCCIALPLQIGKADIPFDYEDTGIEEEFPPAPTKTDVSEEPTEAGNKTDRIVATVYDVPVQLLHAYEDKDSMGNPALEHVARVTVDEDQKVQIALRIRGLHFMNMYGHVWNLFYEDGGWTPATVAQWQTDQNLVGDRQQFPYEFLIHHDQGKRSIISVRVWVDAMDAIASNGAKQYKDITPGSGAQNARLVLDWNSASMVEQRTEHDGTGFVYGDAADADSLREEAAESPEQESSEGEISDTASAESSEAKRAAPTVSSSVSKQQDPSDKKESAVGSVLESTSSEGAASQAVSESEDSHSKDLTTKSASIPWFVLVVLGGCAVVVVIAFVVRRKR